MLSYDSLLEHAKERGMPPGKLRGIAREYLHILILKSLYELKSARDLVFLGGTALRMAHGLKRFSEDLGFDAKDLSFAGWKELLESAAHRLSRLGLSVEARADEKGSLLKGDLRFHGFLQTYQVTSDPKEKLRIKVESNRPDYAVEAQPQAISAFGETFAAVLASPGLAFAEKILAFNNRELGRDIYDIFFMTGMKWAPDLRVLRARGVDAPPSKAILQRVGALSPNLLKKMAAQLEPFLFEHEQARMVAEANVFLPQALEYLG